MKKVTLFLKSTILHCVLRCSYSLSCLKSSQSVLLLHQPPAFLVHQSSKNSPLRSCRISSSPKRFQQANGWQLFAPTCRGFLSQKCITKTLQFKELFLFICLSLNRVTKSAGPTHMCLGRTNTFPQGFPGQHAGNFKGNFPPFC